MNISKYYILVDEDLVPQYPHSATDVTKIGITASENRRLHPIIIMEGKGHGLMGGILAVNEITHNSYYLPLFEKYNIVWILDFICNNSNFTEESLQQEILSHSFELVTEEH